MTDPSDSQLLDVRFPGLAWMPRWTRRYWTPQTAVGIALAIFSIGSWVGTYLTKPDVSALTKDMGELTKTVGAIQYVMGPSCVRNCMLTHEGISAMEDHVSDLWAKKIRTEKEAEKPVEYKRYTAPARRHK